MPDRRTRTAYGRQRAREKFWHEHAERVRVVEIVAPVIATLRKYVDGGGRSGVDALLSNPKFEVVLGDGRHVMALDAERYDVIEADAIMPKTALSGLLHSQEFLRQVRAKLAPCRPAHGRTSR